MTYNDIVTPIRKTQYGEADIIYTFISAHHGRIDAIAKGIRKTTSRKRGNIELGAFTSMQFAKGKNMDVAIEANMLDYNEDLFSHTGLILLYKILPLLNKYCTDIEHTSKIFNITKEAFIQFDSDTAIFYECYLKYNLLSIQDLLPDWSKCMVCQVKYDFLDKANPDIGLLICNNCARKIEPMSFSTPTSVQDLEGKKNDLEYLKILVKILDRFV